MDRSQEDFFELFVVGFYSHYVYIIYLLNFIESVLPFLSTTVWVCINGVSRFLQLLWCHVLHMELYVVVSRAVSVTYQFLFPRPMPGLTVVVSMSNVESNTVSSNVGVGCFVQCQVVFLWYWSAASLDVFSGDVFFHCRKSAVWSSGISSAQKWVLEIHF